ncbi:site-specific integrase [Sinirhodobacter populi]|uniref:Site-specific integrase n=1 Tax=Paenirhodobacter populi TaxID=2306993 RepID=A0A443JXB9_9RHOB|nr:site-specific integrase [Sinirhodobacter populi]RWR25162.1 site-specific integrase [Sinirhodobacter populi]
MLASERYFCRVKRLILQGGERFATVVDAAGVPAYYPTALAIARRSRGVSSETMAAQAADLVHIGLWARRENIDINARLEAGDYFGPVEIDTLAEACGVSTTALRRLISPRVAEIRRGLAFTSADLVTSQQKSRRLTTALRYFEFVGQMSEVRLAKKSPELSERVLARQEMVALIATYRPKVRSSRVRGVIKAEELARVATFVATGSPAAIWADDAVVKRNWAIVTLLITCGILQGEARQLKPEDIDLGACELRVERRHDDPDDERVYEPNAKTFDRIVPLSPNTSQILEDNLLGPGSDAAERRGAPFLFLSHDKRTFGTPISARTVQRIVRDVGLHLGLEGLTPHHLRHGWIQELANWSIKSGIDAAEFERFANHLGGWSYVSRMAADYRADHLTEEAYKAGIMIQEMRS